MGGFIRIGPGIEEGEPSLCGGASMAVIPGRRPRVRTMRIRIPKLTYVVEVIDDPLFVELLVLHPLGACLVVDHFVAALDEGLLQ